MPVYELQHDYYIKLTGHVFFRMYVHSVYTDGITMS